MQKKRKCQEWLIRCKNGQNFRQIFKKCYKSYKKSLKSDIFYDLYEFLNKIFNTIDIFDIFFSTSQQSSGF